MPCELTVLVENTALQPELACEHGLSMLLEAEGLRVLIDTGRSARAPAGNAERLGVDLASVDATVLTHGHYDHSGGLPLLMERCDRPVLYAHPNAFAQRWSDKPDQPRKDVSCPHSLQSLVDAGMRFRPVTEPTRLAEGLILSGPIGGDYSTPESFLIRSAGRLQRDDFSDELCVLARGTDGWAVITGCCHRGVRNTLQAARALVQDEPLTALIGGLHLRSSSREEIAAQAELIRASGIARVFPCHCTGDHAIRTLSEELPGRVTPIRGGSRVSL
ncbi:MAG: MBL fold metallo-hydrolase [Phycisphaerae bacterium]